MTATTEVLIVGAGPTGLMLALQLARRGVTVRIVDRNHGPAHESRAVVVQARTLEYYHQLGFAGQAVREGRCLARVAVLRGGRVRAEIPIGRVGAGQTRFPFALAFGQDQNEALLITQLAMLGVTVERSVEATQIEDRGASLRVRLERRATLSGGDASGSARSVTDPSSGAANAVLSETLAVPWLCGCDGASSTVRHAMGLSFEGGTYEDRFYLVDCRVDGPIADDGVIVAPERRGLVAFFAMGGERRFRIIGRLPPELEHAERIEFETIAPLVIEKSGLPLTLSAPRWANTYKLHHRCAEQLRAGREGRVLIVGDAAHVHSPVGGQGMNTGLQDATNLAWKLALVLRGGASPPLLDSYGDERLPVARQLLRTTDRLFVLATSQSVIQSALRALVVSVVLPALVRLPLLRRFAFRLVSQIGISYNQRSLANRALAAGSLRAPVAPGERLPFAEFAGVDGAPRDLIELCRAPWFTAIVAGAASTASFETALASHPALAPFVALRSLAPTEGNRAALTALGAAPPAPPRIVIVRPDLHLFGVWPLDRARDACEAIAAAVQITD